MSPTFWRRSLRRLKYHLDAGVLRNPPSRRRLRRQAPVLDEVQRRVVDRLSTDGIAVLPAGELPALASTWPELRAAGRAFAGSARVAREVERYRRTAGDGGAGSESYLVQRQRSGGVLQPDDPLLRFGLDPAVLDTVNVYLGLWSRLIYADVWYTIPSAVDRAPVASQRWHRDPEDAQLVKVFLYCEDVDRDGGPFEYVRGSARGPHRELWPNPDPFSASYPPPGAVEERIPAADRLCCTGPAGTLIFCDTHGLHRGGQAYLHPRILATWVFVPPASPFDRRYAVEAHRSAAAGSDAARFALGI